MRTYARVVPILIVFLCLFPAAARAQTNAPDGVVGSVCAARPWATSIIAAILPDGLFDGLCVRLGYTHIGVIPNNDDTEGFAIPVPRGITCPSYVRPGTSAALSWSCGTGVTLSAVAGFALKDRTQTRANVTPANISQVYGIRCSDGFESLCTVRTIDPQVLIWADPASVRLGSRANIFWSAKDVVSCRVTGPSFEETGTNGGASTVSITKASTFTAACDTGAGDTVTASIVVDFAR